MSFCFLINCFFPQFFFIFLSKTKQKAANSTVFEFHLFLSWFLVFHQSWKHPAERKETSSERRKDVSVGRSGWNMISDTPQTHTHTHTHPYMHTRVHMHTHTHTQRHTHTLFLLLEVTLYRTHNKKQTWTICHKNTVHNFIWCFITSMSFSSNYTVFSVFFFYMFLF